MPSEVAFEDETDRTAADYHVIPVGTSPAFFREASESQSSASMAALPSSSSSAVLPVSRPVFSTPDLGAIKSEPEPGLFSAAFNNLLSSDALGDHQKLNNFNEALLLRHFRNTLGSWMDVCDHEKHFSTDVVERAPSCPLLLYACLAIAARHLSHTTNTVPSSTADGYHERCIAILLPVLENSEFKIGIEILLASTVILRFFEQISSQSPSNDLQRHLLAGSVYISSHVDCAISGGLAEASFWVFVTQDIQFALTYRNPLRLPINPFEERLHQRWKQNTAQSDRDWTHRAIWLLAETINHCYGANHPLHMGTSDGGTLKRKISTWEMEKPEGFHPLHFSPANPSVGRPFPLIWFTSSAHGGSWIRDPLAQNSVLDLLRRTEAENGWPWAFAVQKLSQDWRLTTR
ncbi:uncharacterized protein ATNIH1004_006776 [Aspergillus tanneri]|uniref:Transcription factor domain-containing protein n=1 Tax=Aspergillus tanneri TaxID=1220188 RepID=A0A5M9MS19_9EURO|nr:uncharacterized protein ATNIH1004_006776 [Aspergillus tanneri]KAA8645357.1 hypothetical protein ATNIH1004_006776 [Aspergillus tanneri]